MPNIVDNVEALRNRQSLYQRVFWNEYGKAVIDDLARFCHAFEPTYKDNKLPQPNALLVAEGRREVFWRIMQHLQLNTDQLVALYGGRWVDPITLQEVTTNE